MPNAPTAVAKQIAPAEMKAAFATLTEVLRANSMIQDKAAASALQIAEALARGPAAAGFADPKVGLGPDLVRAKKQDTKDSAR